jgi:hypothetical protein
MATSALTKLFEGDREDRKDFATDWETARRLRLEPKGNQRPAYPNAPVGEEPIIDDNVRSITSAEMTMLWSARNLAAFLPADAAGMELKRQAEAGFDTMLRLTLRTRARLEVLLDGKNERGLAIAKKRLREKDGETWPDFEAVHPNAILFPAGCRDLANADRIAHMRPFTARELKAEARRMQWDEEAVKLVLGEGDETGSNEEAKDVVKGDGLDPEQLPVVRSGAKAVNVTEPIYQVYEAYHFEDVQIGEVKEEGDETDIQYEPRRVRTTYVGGHEDNPLAEAPWSWPDRVVSPAIVNEEGETIQEQVVEHGGDRPWPFVAFRFENRVEEVLDTRGVAQLLTVQQADASGDSTLKKIWKSYAAKPLLKGKEGVGRSSKWRPGDVMPEGLDFASPPELPKVFDYDIDDARRAAARRAGSPQGAMSSQDKSREARAMRMVLAAMSVEGT